MADSREQRAEALNRIEEAARTRATALSLRGMGLTELPREIGKLTGLASLDLSRNQLTALPPEIGKLTNLTSLPLWRNHLTTVPPEIGNLTNLSGLHLSENQLVTLPPEIGKLTNLTSLDLGNNQLSALPPEIGKLTNLTRLDLENNQRMALPPEIGKLTNLTQLDLHNNQLVALPPEIGKLTSLVELYLGGNRFMALSPEIGKLTNLTELYLHDNKLTALLPEIGKLTNLTTLILAINQLTALPPEIRNLTNLTELYLHDNPGLNIPPEILGPMWYEVRSEKAKPASPQAILDYYFRTHAQPTRRLNEAKVLLVGEAAVGKSSLVAGLVRNEPCALGRKMTEGIQIDRWEAEGKHEGETIRLNVWDFGGQEIMHATHQFFLTKRSLYLVVLDARQDEKQCRLEYWLRLVQSFGGDSPIIVVINKIDDGRLKLDRNGLMKKYEPNLRGFVETSCQSLKGMDELRELIGREVRGMEHVDNKLPESYFEVKEDLEKEKETTPHLRYDEYQTICANHQVKKADEQDQLAQFLHDLGTILSFRHDDRLAALGVLSPAWVTGGVYAIITSERLNNAGGILCQECLEQVLTAEKYPPANRSFIVEMMKKFELCFEFDGPSGRQWLIPGLLGKERPPLDWDGKKQKELVRFEYRYSVLPGSVIWRFIVRNHDKLGDAPVYWRAGVVIHVDGAEALVIADEEDKQLSILVRGATPGQRRAALTHVRMELEHIHGNLSRIEPKGKVPLPDHPEVAVEYKHLLRLEEKGESDYWPEGAERSYPIAQLLDGIEDKSIRGWNRFGYRMLQPPFFVVEPETSFADAWEVFCCDVLNRHYKTDTIRQRKPPEGGVDLYCSKKKVAYQCKSVEDEGGRFSLTKAMASIDAAKETRRHLPWEKFVLCSNVIVTGEQERKLREKLKEGELEFLTPSFWQPRCVEQREHLRGRFNVLARVDEDGRLMAR